MTPCTDADGCDDFEQCFEGFCAPSPVPADAGPLGDAGAARDAGTSVDGGILRGDGGPQDERDSGPRDAGASLEDAGLYPEDAGDEQPDAGIGDGGVAPDAGATPDDDAGAPDVDAGPPTAFGYAPSNVDPAQWPPTASGDLSACNGTVVVDTEALVANNWCAGSITVAQSSSVDLSAPLVVALDDLIVPGSLTLQINGRRPIIFLVHGFVDVAGTITVRPELMTDAVDVYACAGGDGETQPYGHNGGGGGGFGSAGGRGGLGNLSGTPPSGGGQAADLDLVPLRGGCDGGGGSSGAGGPYAQRGVGGGALQISAAEAMTVTGAIHVAGTGGRGAVGGHNAGVAGGGSGGGLLLEAATLNVASSAFLDARGGGGGGGATVNGGDAAPGADARVRGTSQSVPGGAGGDSGGRGGDGMSAARAAGQRGTDATATGAGGGGGGGGVIILRAASCQVTGVSWPASQGCVDN